jgi:hypothetical protein
MKVYQKAKAKLPTFTSSFLAIDDRSYQQSTSENVARFKSKILKGESLLDLSAGIGVDDLFFCKSFENVVGIDNNQELNELAKYNFKRLKIDNYKRLTGNAEDTIQGKWSCIYVDPDRRKESERKVMLEDLSPNVLQLLPEIKKHTQQLAIKLSPLFDISEAERVFDDLSEVYVLSDGNEVKELLLVLDFGAKRSVKYFAIETKKPRYALEFDSDEIQIKVTSKANKYLYQPHAALRKIKYADKLFSDLGCAKLLEFAMYTSEKKMKGLGFKSLEVVYSDGLNAKSIGKYLKEQSINKLNISIKGLPDSTTKWHKKLKTKDGGDYFLYLLKSNENRLSVLAKLIS